MIRPAVAIGRISVPWQDDLDAHLRGTPHNCVKVVNFKPQQNAVSIRLVVPIGDGAVMMFHFEAVQLKHKFAIRNQLFIGAAAMIAPAPEQTLVPSAARFHICYSD